MHLFSQMKFKLLLFFNSILLLNTINCEEEIKPRVLNRADDYAFPVVEQQTIQEYSQNASAVEASFDDVIEEIIDSSRQGRNIDGLDEVYADPTVKQALANGDDTQARNLIRDKLCDLGLMECDKRTPVRYIYTQPPPSAIYSNRPGVRPPPPQVASGAYGQARPVPIPGSFPPQQQPPRKVGYASSNLNNFQYSSKPIGPIRDKYSTDFYDVDQAPSSVKFGYTEKPTIVINQGKREANGIPGGAGVSQNHHVHHHYVHVDGNAPVDGSKILVNTPISEYSAVNSLSGSYQTSGFGASGGGNSLASSNGFSPSAPDFEYKGVNSGSQGIYGGAASSNVRPVYESSQGQYASGTNYNQQSAANFNQQTDGNYNQFPPQQNVGPAVFTDNNNGLYNNIGGSNSGSSFHSSAPNAYKKELNLNGNRGNGLSASGYYGTQQQFNNQKYSKNQYNQGEQYQGFESARQDQFDCVCTPFDQCPAQDVVGRRDDLVLPLDPRNLPTEIEADGDNSTSHRVVKEADAKNSTEVHKVAKREIDDVKKADGEGVSRNDSIKYLITVACRIFAILNQLQYKTNN